MTSIFSLSTFTTKLHVICDSYRLVARAHLAYVASCDAVNIIITIIIIIYFPQSQSKKLPHILCV